MNQGRRYRSFAPTLLTATVEVFPQVLPQVTEVWQSRQELSSQETNSLLERPPGRYRVLSSSELR